MEQRSNKEDRKLDKEVLAELVRKAIGKKTQIQFSEETGISKFHVNRLINGKIDKAPRPKTLFAIAAAAENRVTFSQLLNAAGYDEKEEKSFQLPTFYKRKAAITSQEVERFVRLGIATVAMALEKTKYHQVYVDDKKTSEDYDFAVQLFSGDKMVRWQVKFLLEMPVRKEKTYTIDFVYYRKINGEEVPEEVPVVQSYVTESEELYEALIAMPPATTCAYSSIILINPKRLAIVKSQIVKGEEEGKFVFLKLG